MGQGERGGGACARCARAPTRARPQTRAKIAEYADKAPVAALIVEPVQAEGGDRHAPASFFRGLRQLCLDHGVAFIVDEVQTGTGATGTMWAHEQWELETPPDMVTFSKKSQIAGYFARPDFLPAGAYRIFNTWMGDPAKMLQLKVCVCVCGRVGGGGSAGQTDGRSCCAARRPQPHRTPAALSRSWLTSWSATGCWRTSA